MNSSVIIQACYLDGADAHGDIYLNRVEKFLDYYSNDQLKNDLNYSKIIFLDNGSKTELPKRDNVEIIKFPHLKHGSHYSNQYPGLWRAIYYCPRLLNKYEKIIWLDNDAFILTKKLTKYIRNIDSGLIGFTCKRYDFPEAALFVLCKNGGQEAMNEWTKKPYDLRFGERLEDSIPFTKVVKDFNCDRFGDVRPNPPEQTSDMDMYNNAIYKTKFIYNMENL